MVKNNLARLAIAGTFLLSANWAWGTTAACSQPSPTTISNLQTTAGFGSYCYETDKTFSNVTVTDGGSTVGGVTQSASTIALQGSDNLSTYTTGVPWMVAANFVGATPADFQASSTSSGSYAATYGQMTFLVTSSSTAANLAYPTPQAGQFNDITGVSLAADATIGNSSTTDFAQVEMAFCIGSASCTADNIVEHLCDYRRRGPGRRLLCGTKRRDCRFQLYPQRGKCYFRERCHNIECNRVLHGICSGGHQHDLYVELLSGHLHGGGDDAGALDVPADRLGSGRHCRTAPSGDIPERTLVHAINDVVLYPGSCCASRAEADCRFKG